MHLALRTSLWKSTIEQSLPRSEQQDVNISRLDGDAAAPADLVKLHSELSSTFQRRGERIQVLAPEGKELLDAQAAQRVVAGVANAVLLAHRHHLVVHVQGVLRRAKGEAAIRCSASS